MRRPEDPRPALFFLVQPSYNAVMSGDEYHEAILQRLHELEGEIAELSQREALSYAYLVSREMPEEAARMLVAEMLMDCWRRSIRKTSSTAF